jgi:putative transposase
VAENEEYKISDGLWEKIKPLLPPDPPGNNRSEMDKRKVMEGIFYVIRAGCEWEGIPRDIGIGNVVYEYFLEWRKTGVFDRMWQSGILTHEELRTLIWRRR